MDIIYCSHLPFRSDIKYNQESAIDLSNEVVAMLLLCVVFAPNNGVFSRD